MLRAMRYSLTEAAASLWRSRGSAALAMLTIAAGLFVLGFFLVVNANLQRLMARWNAGAELSVFRELNSMVRSSLLERPKDRPTLSRSRGEPFGDGGAPRARRSTSGKR